MQLSNKFGHFETERAPVLRATVWPARVVAARRLYLAAVSLCGSVLAALAITFAVLLRSGDAGMKQTDFVAYYTASRLVLTGHGDETYQMHTLGRAEADLVRPLTVRNGVLPYIYPPFFVIALAPLAALPYDAAFLMWLGFNAGLLVVVLCALQRKLRLSAQGKLLFWLASLSFLPVFVALAQGQSSIVLLGLLTAAFLAAESDHDLAAGAALGLCCFKPTYLVPVLLAFILWARWRVVAATAVTLLGLLALSLPVGGFSAIAAYVHTLLAATSWHGVYGYVPQLNHSFSGAAELLLPQPASTALTFTLDLLALGAVGWAALRWRQHAATVALSLLVGILISPHVLVHDLAVLLLPAALLLSCRFERVYTLPSLLALCYAAVLVGLKLSWVTPIQLSVLALGGLGIWLLLQAGSEDWTAVAVPLAAEGPDR